MTAQPLCIVHVYHVLCIIPAQLTHESSVAHQSVILVTDPPSPPPQLVSEPLLGPHGVTQQEELAEGLHLIENSFHNPPPPAHTPAYTDSPLDLIV